MNHVTMLLFKDIYYDARVKREAISLADEGYRVRIICLKEYDEIPDDIIHSKIEIIKVAITSKKAKYKFGKQSNSNNDKNKLIGTLKKYLIKLIRIPLIKLIKDVISYQEFYSKSKKTIIESDLPVDVIHCHDLNTLKTGVKLSGDFNAKLVYDSHELFNEMAGRNRLDRWYGYQLEKKMIRRINHLIVVNPFVKEEFVKMYGDIPITIIQNTPISNIGIHSEIEKNYFRKQYKLDQSDIILLYQGGLNPERGIEESILSLKSLPKQYKLILMGEGRLVEQLKELVNDVKLNNRVFFHEQVPSSKVLEFTKQADIGLVMYLNTSRNNYFSTPNKIFEYMIAGIPTVASNHPGKSYVVEVEKTGLCTEETPEAISAAVLKVFENYDFFKNNCLDKSKYYTWEVEKNKLVVLYRSLLATEKANS
ncbi:glycosyltransferase involved in cell wall biosynthesis [Bacillus pakistanensis]|uniref:Glycosyltransferase involved in cell wall biosynthesis n=1 Tax=Rossellomorea pakistanensis TaxID=992288 RepID=A0ABS2ND29_9BACI|nr:glycosyltransferase [Bacillus pakistanensis]MBM7585764.1 glycosyltransferase involved in cell wall biosynthesis [Bacillus pakistanensis]